MTKERKLSEKINWSEFLSRHDLIWPELKYKGGFVPVDEKSYCTVRHKREWEEGAFTGNGMIGTMITKESPDVLAWELGRNDVVAHNFLEDVDWATPRVPIGNIHYFTSGNVVKESMKLSLWDAEVTGVIETDAGTINWRSITHANKDVIVIEVKTTDGENNSTFGFQPIHGVSPRLQYSERNPAPKYLAPAPIQFLMVDINVSVQTFIKDLGNGVILPEGECASAWKEVHINEGHRVFYCSITNSSYDNSARKEAVKNIKEAVSSDLETFIEEHRKWWHSYYPISFLSLDDTSWEGFYWIQMYKLASAIRDNNTMLDVHGPWLTTTPWPTNVWNLNVQLAYMPVYTSNRLFLGESLLNSLFNNIDVLIENAKPAGINDGMFIGRSSNTVDLRDPWPSMHEIGNLTWALHNIWRHYRCCMNEELLRDKLYPLLKGSINLFMHIMFKGEDGKWHLPESSSPEYPGASATHCLTKDCNYSLSLFKWGCETLIKINNILYLKPSEGKKWADVLENLVDYPVNENGFMVGADIPFAMSHRHYSHLFMIYPLHLLNVDQKENHDLINKSISHWIGFEGALAGYSFTGASAMAASMGNGDKALEYLNGLKPYLKPNTMYMECGPVIETPLSCAESIHYMLLQSWGDTIRVFEGVPEKWQNIALSDLLAEGAFEISASRKDGKTEFIQIRSLAGSPLKIKPNFEGTVKVSGQREYFLFEIEEGIYTLQLLKGETVVLYDSEEVPEIEIKPVPTKAEELNFYGSGR